MANSMYPGNIMSFFAMTDQFIFSRLDETDFLFNENSLCLLWLRNRLVVFSALKFSSSFTATIYSGE